MCYLQHLESWLSSGQDHERERAVAATAHILAYYLDNLNVKVHRDTNTDIVNIIKHRQYMSLAMNYDKSFTIY